MVATKTTFRLVATVCSAILLLCAAASAIALVRSFITGDVVQFFRQRHATPLADAQQHFQISSGLGGLTLAWGQITFEYADDADAQHWRTTSGYYYDNRLSTSRFTDGPQYGGANNSEGQFGFLGFGTRSWNGYPPGDHGRTITLPWIALILVCGIEPTLRIRRSLRKRHRLRHGLCLACGYDLRASGQHCPECGATKMLPRTA